jgi:hypothetical protein
MYTSECATRLLSSPFTAGHFDRHNQSTQINPPTPFQRRRWAQPCTRDNYITALRIEFAYCSWKKSRKNKSGARVHNKDWYRARRGLRNSARALCVMARMKSLSNHDFANRAKSWVTQGHRVMFWPAKCTRQM